MGIVVRRRVQLGRNTWANVSRHGVSVSRRIGRVTVNTRRNVWVRLVRGVFYRSHI